MTDERNPITPEQLSAAVGVIIAVGTAIRELGRVPSGHLYAGLMGQMDLRTFESVIETLKKAGLVEERNHELIWKEPRK